MSSPTTNPADYIRIMLDKTYNNRPLALTLFKKLFEELPEQISAIKEALENRQYTLARQITHKLHGAVSFCGLADMQEPAQALESSLLNHDDKAADRHFLVLKQCISSFTRHQAFIIANLTDDDGQ